MLRGGSWGDLPGTDRAAHRLRYDPAYRYDYCGFRLAAARAASREG